MSFTDTMSTTPPPGLPGLNLGTIDEKLQSINAVDSQWGLPQLPDEVRLDLASHPDHDHDSLSEFLWGLAHDVNQAVNPLAAAPAGAQTTTDPAVEDPAAAPVLPELLLPGDDSFGLRASKFVSQIAGLPAPEVLDPITSASSLKRKAIARGILAPDTPIDERWDPSLNSVRYQLMQDDFRNAVSGEKAGSVPADNVLDLIGEWTDPRTLLHVAEKLDFDPTEHFRHGDVTREWRTWGDKWRRWHDAATHGAGNVKRGQLFLDALTGPIDDVAWPLLNDVLLLTGVSEVLGGTKAALVGGEAAVEGAEGLKTLYAAKNITAANRLYNPIKAYQGAEIAGSAAREGSFLGKTIGYAGARAGEESLLGRAATDVSGRMLAWRNLRSVRAASTALGAGARLGIVGTAEEKLFPNQSYTRDITEWKQQRNMMSPLGVGADAFFLTIMPPTYFAQGTFTQLGRPVAAVASHFRKVTQEAGATVEVGRAYANLIEDADQKAQYLKTMSKRGPAVALAEHLGDEEKAGHFVTWSAYVTAIDADAVRLADIATGGRSSDPAKWKQIYLRVRNARIAQLRSIDEGDHETFMSILREKVGTEKGSGRLVRRWQAKLKDPALRDLALEEMNGLIRDHNEKRVGMSQQLLDNLRPGMVEQHVGTFFKNGEAWGPFLAANDTLRQMTTQEGVLDAPATIINDLGKTVRNPEAPSYAKAFSPNSRALNLHSDTSLAHSVLAAAEEHPDMIYRAWFQPLAREIVPGRGRFGLARLDSVTKQEAVELLSTVKVHKQRIEDLRWLEAHPEVHEKLVTLAEGLPTPLRDMHPQDLHDALRDFYAGQAAPFTSKMQRGARSVRRVALEGFDPALPESITAAREALEARLNDISNHHSWSEWFGIPTHWDIDKKTKSLAKLQHMLAAEVEGLPPEQVAQLNNLGYKVVHGVEYLMPNDLLDLVRPLAETNRATMAQYSLGAFVQPVRNDALSSLIHQKLHSELADTFIRAGVVSPEVLKNQQPGVTGDIDDVVNRLYTQLRDRHTALEKSLDSAQKFGGMVEKTAARWQSGFVPYGLRDLSKSDIETAIAGTVFSEDPRNVDRIRASIARAYNVGFRYNGLAAIEDNIRANGFMRGLNLLPHTEAGGAMFAKSVAARSAVGGAIGAGMGGLQGWANGQNPEEILGTAAAGFVGGAAVTAGFETTGLAAEKAMSVFGRGAAWERYSRLPNTLAKIRNQARFTLSPFFDLRRYVKGAAIAQLHELPDEARLPLFSGMRSLRKQFGEEGVTEAQALWNAASKGQFDALDDSERFFRQVGMLGYSSKDMQASAYYRLVREHGIDPSQAYEHVMKIYAYGLGRSPLEKSINFVWFPFSFEKKLVTNGAHFLSQDLSRVVLLHDMLKTYDTLNERYDLSARWEKYLPILHELKKLNAFEHGISPGELGGINRPLFEPAIDEILNMFLPQGAVVEDKSGAEHIQQLVKRMLPAVNDISRMIDDLKEEGHVLMDPAHQTRQAQVDEAYAYWTNFRDSLDAQLKAQGVKDGFVAIGRRKKLAPLKEMVDQYKAELIDRYPAWVEARADVTKRRQMDEEEVKAIALTEDAKLSPAEQDLKEFYEFEQELRANLGTAGFSLESAPEDLPGDLYVGVREYAAELAARGNGFEQLYRKYYQRTYGPITRSIR